MSEDTTPLRGASCSLAEAMARRDDELLRVQDARRPARSRDLLSCRVRRFGVRRFAVAVLCLAVLSGCGGQSARPSTSTARPVRAALKAPAALISTPSWALAACGTVREVRRFCPARVPVTRKREWTMIFHSPTRRFPLALFELESGVVWGGFEEHVHRPPILGNTVVLGGAFMTLDARAFPAADARPVAVRNGIANGLRRRPIALGPRAWSGLRGELSLTPSSYADEGELSDLVVFRWRDSAGDHAVGVNVWEPLTDAVATLRAIVSTLAHARGGNQARPVASVAGIPMTTTPGWLAALCATEPLLRLACPTRIPAATAAGAYVDVVPTPRSEEPKLTSLLVSVQSATDRLPFHLELTAGYVASGRRYAARKPISRVTVPRGFVVTRPIPLGRRDWTTRPGTLVFGDCYGNHLCYRWRQNGRGYQIDLHAWDPVAQTAHVLRAIVVSTPAGRG
jgi:hypothetical protein